MLSTGLKTYAEATSAKRTRSSNENPSFAAFGRKDSANSILYLSSCHAAGKFQLCISTDDSKTLICGNCRIADALRGLCKRSDSE